MWRGGAGRKGWDCSGSWNLTPVLSLQLEQRGRLQKSVAKEVSGQRACVRLEGIGVPPGLVADGSAGDSGCGVCENMVGTWTDRVSSGLGSLAALGRRLGPGGGEGV